MRLSSRATSFLVLCALAVPMGIAVHLWAEYVGLGDADESGERVEKVRQENRDDRREQRRPERAPEIELEKNRVEIRTAHPRVGPLDDPQKSGDERDPQDCAEKRESAAFARERRAEDQATHAEGGLDPERACFDESDRVALNNPCVAQAYEGEENPDAHRRRMPEPGRDRFRDPDAKLGRGQHHKKCA